MRTRTCLSALAAFALALPAAGRAEAVLNPPLPAPAPAEAGWSLTLEAFTGGSRYDALGLKSGLTRTGVADLLQGGHNVLGADAILRFGWFEAGAVWEGGLDFRSTQSGVLSPTAGVKLDLLPWLRLEALAELGGHHYSNIGAASGWQTSGTDNVWVAFAGLRPGLSVRVPVGPTRLVIGAWAFSRWDLVHRTVNVTIVQGSSTAINTYDVGGSTFGIVGRIGIEI